MKRRRARKKKKKGGEVSELSILLGLAAEKERKQVKRPSEQKGRWSTTGPGCATLGGGVTR